LTGSHEEMQASGIADTRGPASLENVVVVLSRTTEPMNIGAACRAMKTMGLKQLRLIDPLNPKGRSAQMISYRRGPMFEHIPRAQILWDTAFRIGDAPMVVRELHYSWSQINALATQNSWMASQVKKIQHQDGLDSPGGEALAKSREREGLTNSSGTEPHDIREIHVDWPVLQATGAKLDMPGDERLGKVSPPLVAVVHRQSRRLLHLKAEPYNLPYKPFFDGYFRKRPGRAHSWGLAKILFPMQLIMTTLLNQSIDARTRANSVWAKTNRRELLDRPLDPSHPVYAPEGSVFEPLALQTNPLQDISIFNIANIQNAGFVFAEGAAAYLDNDNSAKFLTHISSCTNHVQVVY